MLSTEELAIVTFIYLSLLALYIFTTNKEKHTPHPIWGEIATLIIFLSTIVFLCIGWLILSLLLLPLTKNLQIPKEYFFWCFGAVLSVAMIIQCLIMRKLRYMILPDRPKFCQNRTYPLLHKLYISDKELGLTKQDDETWLFNDNGTKYLIDKDLRWKVDGEVVRRTFGMWKYQILQYTIIAPLLAILLYLGEWHQKALAIIAAPLIICPPHLTRFKHATNRFITNGLKL